MVYCIKFGRQVRGRKAKVGTPQKPGLCHGCRFHNSQADRDEPSLVRLPDGSLWCRHNLTNQQALLLDFVTLARMAKKQGMIA